MDADNDHDIDPGCRRSIPTQSYILTKPMTNTFIQDRSYAVSDPILHIDDTIANAGYRQRLPGR